MTTYGAPPLSYAGSRIDQGDIIDGCPLTLVSRFELDDLARSEIKFAPARVSVLTQTCDLVNQKAAL